LPEVSAPESPPAPLVASALSSELDPGIPVASDPVVETAPLAPSSSNLPTAPNPLTPTGIRSNFFNPLSNFRSDGPILSTSTFPSRSGTSGSRTVTSASYRPPRHSARRGYPTRSTPPPVPRNPVASVHGPSRRRSPTPPRRPTVPVRSLPGLMDGVQHFRRPTPNRSSPNSNPRDRQIGSSRGRSTGSPSRPSSTRQSQPSMPRDFRQGPSHRRSAGDSLRPTPSTPTVPPGFRRVTILVPIESPIMPPPQHRRHNLPDPEEPVRLSRSQSRRRRERIRLEHQPGSARRPSSN